MLIIYVSFYIAIDMIFLENATLTHVHTYNFVYDCFDKDIFFLHLANQIYNNNTQEKNKIRQVTREYEHEEKKTRKIK